jgi:hypothetical protein
MLHYCFVYPSHCFVYLSHCFVYLSHCFVYPSHCFVYLNYLFHFSFLRLNYSFYFAVIRIMIILFFVCSAVNFVCSAFLYCFVYCFSLCTRLFLFDVCTLYGPLPLGENPTAVNKYHITSYHHSTNNSVPNTGYVTRILFTPTFHRFQF